MKKRKFSVDLSKDIHLTAKNNRVQQSAKAKQDVNFIVGQYIRQNGHEPLAEDAGGFFRDVSTVGDFGDIMDRVLLGKDLFSGLDARVRARFNNNAGEFMKFASDPANHDSVMEFGFGVKPPVKGDADYKGPVTPLPAPVPVTEAPTPPGDDPVPAPTEPS